MEHTASDVIPVKGKRRVLADEFSDPMLKMVYEYFGFTPNDRVLILDIGCGSGARIPELYDMGGGVKLVGIDIHFKSLARARQCDPDTMYVCGSVEELPFQEGSFDAIFSYSVLQLVDWKKVVALCERVLKPGGKAVFIENLADNPFTRLYRVFHRLVGWKYPSFQTPKKHIQWGDLAWFRNQFEMAEFAPYFLTAPLIMVGPSLERLIRNEPKHAPSHTLFKILYGFDRFLLTLFPFLARICWRVVICVTKK